MAEKLGALLLQADVITPQQLEQALEAQVMLGGRLGTNLIELGFINEEFLAQFLATQMNLAYCPAKELNNISPDVLRLLSREIVEKLQAVPISVSQDEVRVALIDPKSVASLEELALFTKKKVMPMIASESQVVAAMEKYYQIPKPKRYVDLGRRARGSAHLAFDDFKGKMPEEGASKGAKKSKKKPPSYAFQWPDAPHSSEGRKTNRHTPEEPLLTALMDASLPDSLFPLNEIGEVLIEAKNKEDIFQAIQSPFIEFFDRFAIFVNKNDVMIGTIASGFPQDMIEAVAIPLKVPSIFRESAERRIPIFGPIPEGHNNRRIAALLNAAENGQPCLLCPIPLVEKVGVMVFADQCRDVPGVAARLDKFKRMMAKAGLAFQVLVLKQKILHL